MPHWALPVALSLGCLTLFNILFEQTVKQLPSPTIAILPLSFAVFASALVVGSVQGHLSIKTLSSVHPSIILWAMLTGICWFGTAHLMGLAFNMGAPLSVAAPILSVGAILLIALYDCFIGGNTPTLQTFIGWAAACVAIVCLVR